MANEKEAIVVTEGEAQTIEIVEEEKVDETPEIPTAEELKEEGLDPKEIEKAKEHGLVEKEDGEKDPDKKPEAKKKDEKKSEKKEVIEKKGEETDIEEAFSNPEKEKELFGKFNKNEQGLYFKMKKERAKRQTSETEKEHLQIKIKALQEEVDKKPEEVVEEDDDLLTEEEKEEKRKKKEKKVDPEEEKKKTAIANQQRGELLKSKLNEHEIEARQRHDNFDEGLELSNKVLVAFNSKTLDKIYENPHQRSKIIRKVQEFFQMVANADEIQEGEFNTADMAYEIGILHPDYNPDTAGEKKSGKKNSDLNPEKVEKIVENSKRKSSASLTGGDSKRVISVNDITVEQAAKLTDSAYADLPKPVRERLKREAM